MATKKTKTKEISKEFAVIETGGKQYIVSAGETVRIEKLRGATTAGSAREIPKLGDAVTFDKVLIVDNGTDTTLGAPYIKGASVSAEITKVGRATKVDVIKYKAKSNYFKKRGHRQPYVEVMIKKLA